MPTKKQKVTLVKDLTPERTKIIWTELEKARFTILPSTQNEVGKILKRAVAKGKLTTEEDVAVAAAALISAAAEEAASQGTRQVRVAHLNAGWYQRLAVTGNCPPHKCLKRSVLERQELLMDSSALFRGMRAKF